MNSKNIPGSSRQDDGTWMVERLIADKMSLNMRLRNNNGNNHSRT